MCINIWIEFLSEIISVEGASVLILHLEKHLRHLSRNVRDDAADGRQPRPCAINA